MPALVACATVADTRFRDSAPFNAAASGKSKKCSSCGCWVKSSTCSLCGQKQRVASRILSYKQYDAAQRASDAAAEKRNNKQIHQQQEQQPELPAHISFFEQPAKKDNSRASSAAAASSCAPAESATSNSNNNNKRYKTKMIPANAPAASLRSNVEPDRNSKKVVPVCHDKMKCAKCGVWQPKSAIMCSFCHRPALKNY